MTTNLFWTEGGKALNLALLTLTERLELQETLRHTEATEWLRRYESIRTTTGQANARNWWEKVKSDLKKRRGKAGANTLIAEMNRQRHEIRSTGG
jgi:hypothetical protein